MNTESDALLAFAAATGTELYDTDIDARTGEAWGWMVEAVRTHETIEQFIESSAHYAECTPPKHGEIAGFTFVAFTKIQARRGDTRRPLSVIDFGDVRYALDTDLTAFV